MPHDLDHIPPEPPSDETALHEYVRNHVIDLGKEIANLRGIARNPLTIGRLAVMAEMAHRIVEHTGEMLKQLREREGEG